MSDMKRTSAASGMGTPPESDDSPAYPYGLKIFLTEDEIKKLTLNKELQVGMELSITGKVEVVGVNAGELKNGKDDKRVELQITEMQLEEVNTVSDPQKFYGG